MSLVHVVDYWRIVLHRGERIKIICRGIDWMAGPTFALSHMKYWRDWEKLCICVVLNTKNEITKWKLWPWNRWIVGSWMSCSVTCGGGVKERRVYCQQGHNNSRVNYWHPKSRHLSHLTVNIFITFYLIIFDFIFLFAIIDEIIQVDDVICSALIGHKARTHEPCNTHDCPNWFQGPWSQVKINILYFWVKRSWSSSSYQGGKWRGKKPWLTGSFHPSVLIIGMDPAR